MEVAPTPFAAINGGLKSPEAGSETPMEIHPVGKLSPFSNGVLKRHGYAASPVSYKECLKNHAASIGSHALDGCGEFMPCPSAASNDHFSLKCAACGCHRNFHRREDQPLSGAISTHVIEYQPHHPHHPHPLPLHPPSNRSPDSSSPPPISSSYYPPAPLTLLALSAGMSSPITARKRCRTKFSVDQKQKMLEFAEKLGWKFQKRDEELVREFCSAAGVEKGVLKVWIHNNKNAFAKKAADGDGDGDGERPILSYPQNNDNDNYEENAINHHHSMVQNQNHYHNNGRLHFGTNVSSSSS